MPVARRKVSARAGLPCLGAEKRDVACDIPRRGLRAGEGGPARLLLGNVEGALQNERGRGVRVASIFYLSRYGRSLRSEDIALRTREGEKEAAGGRREGRHTWYGVSARTSLYVAVAGWKEETIFGGQATFMIVASEVEAGYSILDELTFITQRETHRNHCKLEEICTLK